MNLSKMFLLFMFPTLLVAQPDRWQQAAKYDMEIDFNVKKSQFTGKQKLTYFNNSPDTLTRVFYHLYLNAFQPNSMMDVRNQNLEDADKKIGSKIGNLKPNEIGYTKVKSLKRGGNALQYQVNETILEVELDKPLMPGKKAVFNMDFESQVPIQIRRNGRDNAEGISFSMAQWYPKMAEYDYQGWHANPYVGREFYGIWSDFDVKIKIDKKYIIGGTGYLQNPNDIGFGYNDKEKGKRKIFKKKRTWHFKAPNVHDFVWAADPDYKHTKLERKDGIVLHFFYQEGEATTENWERLPAVMDAAFDFINANYGQYPHDQYSFIQGGDGGMEYPMATLITGERNFGSLVGVSIHELMHSWYQGYLGTNESLYAWMDEGFTSWTSGEINNHLKEIGKMKGKTSDQPHARSIQGHKNYLISGKAEPLSTHADHFNTSYAYWLTAYSSGSTFLEQLQYVIGEEATARTMLRYFNTWKFKHPNVNDFIRIAEKESDMELDWYKEYFVNSTKLTDYAIGEVNPQGKRTDITLKRLKSFPMPIDLEVTFTDGKKKMYTIPLGIMRGAKTKENGKDFTVLKDWFWTHPEYSFSLEGEVAKIQIDPTGRLVDMNLEDNSWGGQE